MSDSDSDLDFESADEDIKGEDIDTSDLDIDDEEDELDSKNNKKEVVVKESKKEDKSEEKKEVIEDKHIDSNPTTETPNELKSVKESKTDNKSEPSDESKLVEEFKPVEEPEPIKESKPMEECKPIKEFNPVPIKESKPEPKPVKESKTIEASGGWDADADFSDLDDEEPAPIKDNKPKKESAKSLENKSNEKSGWDNDDFSDIETDATDTRRDTEPIKNSEPNKTDKVQDIKNLSFFNSDKPKKQEESSSWGSWSTFGSNFISTASNLTNQLNSGISTVLESVEATIGAPDPEELAKLSFKEEEKLEMQRKETPGNKNDWIEEESQEWFSMGSNIVTGGLGVLETVGRKTFQAINDKDQNLKQTREFLKNVPTTMTNQKPNLSELLREAQTTKSNSDQLNNQASRKPSQMTFSLFFDEFTGSVHLEALEMLSRQSNVKLEVQPKPAKLKSALLKFNEFFDSEKLNDDLEESDNDNTDSFFEKETFLSDFKMLIKNKSFDSDHFESLLNKYFKKCCFNLDLDKIISSVKQTTDASIEIDSPAELLKGSMKYFALIASRLIEFYHKAAETILVEEKSSKRSKNSLDNIEGIYQITKLCLRSVTILADDFCKKCRTSLKSSEEKSSLNQITADIYLEASNSSTYIADAYLLLEPIIKTHFLDQ